MQGTGRRERNRLSQTDDDHPEQIAAIGSRNDFHAAVRAALSRAADAGSAEIVLIDPTFADWPLGERAVVESLARWVGSQRRLTLLAFTFDELARRQLRFVEWRRQWSHVVHCRHDGELEAGQIPALLVVPDLVSVRLVDRVRYRGTASSRPLDLTQARETADALLQRSVEAFPVTPLGL